MINKKAGKVQWHTNAADIKLNDIDAQLHHTDYVDDFLQTKQFIIAEKGIGKTLLLRKKRYDISQNQKSGMFIPSNSELDIPADFTNLTQNQISLLEDVSKTKILWTIAIQLAAIKKYYYYSPETTNKELNTSVPDLYVQIYKDETTYSTPSEIFHRLIADISKVLQYDKDYSSYINSAYKQIHTPIYIFIDRLDQAMLINTTNVSETMWKTMQTGLLEAAWNLKEHNNHIKIFCSIRKEAYNDYVSPVKSNMRGDICFLNYKETELHDLVNKLADYYEGKGKTIENIVGFGEDGKFIHSKTEREETVFKYMLRHTVEKPRDLIWIASNLKSNIDLESDTETRIEELRVATNKAAEQIAEDIFIEKARFLEYIRDKDERESFLSLIPKNTLNQRIIKLICSNFNKVKDIKFCTKEQCQKDNSNGGCKHPFCELYNIGLFGYVQTDRPHKQIFKNPDDEIVKHLVGRYSYYIVHPSLCEIIKRLRPNNGSKYIVTPGITTGNGYKWEQRESDISDLIDYVMNAGLLEEKENQIIKDLKDKIKDTTNIKEFTQKVKNKIRNIKQQQRNDKTEGTPNNKKSKRNPKQQDGIHILIASPSDLKTRNVFLTEFATYFQKQGYETQCNKRIIIHGYEEIASSLCYAQDKINEKIKKKIDIVVAIFKHKLGNPTVDKKTGKERAKSGTVEELLEYKKYKTFPMAYFCSEPPRTNISKEGTTEVDKKNNEWKRIEDFKTEIEKEIFYKTYKKDSKEELFPLIAKNLVDNINDYFQK